ncbi:S8 family serine peptidase, partial [Meridianimarinicoccus zhengii]|uniref:S8 family serine peptidase n=1 Tax=Meridianimarinicoccus zhengii TaxID=2056810 RepID=UPI001C9A8630
RPARRNPHQDRRSVPCSPTRIAPRTPRAPQSAPRPPQRPVLADAAPDEIVAFDLAPDDLSSLIAEGFTARETATLGGLGVTLHRLGIAPGLDLATARARVAALPSGAGADFNHFYRPEAADTPAPCRGDGCVALRQVDWPAPASCAPVARIGMIDTAVNVDHPALAATPIATLRTAAEDSPPATPAHGTAVAALLVGDPATGLAGLLPGTALIAVDAFHQAGRDERADVVAVLRGLSELADARVDVVNLSIAGPPNALLEDAVSRLAGRGMVLAAAVGNDGPGAPPAYPGAYDPVIAVTAVDADARIYRRAQQGDHVDIAAPGVEVWTAASISGLRPKTGTSFAVPFVTAALARLKAGAPDLDADDLRARLVETARDLGTPGRDPVFGHGLLSAAGHCAPSPQVWTAGAPGDSPAPTPPPENSTRTE